MADIDKRTPAIGGPPNTVQLVVLGSMGTFSLHAPDEPGADDRGFFVAHFYISYTGKEGQPLAGVYARSLNDLFVPSKSKSIPESWIESILGTYEKLEGRTGPRSAIEQAVRERKDRKSRAPIPPPVTPQAPASKRTQAPPFDTGIGSSNGSSNISPDNRVSMPTPQKPRGERGSSANMPVIQRDGFQDR